MRGHSSCGTAQKFCCRCGAFALFAMLADREPGSSDDIADVIAEDLSPKTAQAIAAPFVVTPDYGTRCSTVSFIGSAGKVDVYERRFDSAGELTGETHVEYEMSDERSQAR